MASPEELETYAHQLRNFWLKRGPNTEKISSGDIEYANIVISQSSTSRNTRTLEIQGKQVRRRRVLSTLCCVWKREPLHLEDDAPFNDTVTHVSEPSSQLFPDGWTRSPRAVRSFLQLWRRERVLHGHKPPGQGNGAISDDGTTTQKRALTSIYGEAWVMTKRGMMVGSRTRNYARYAERGASSDIFSKASKLNTAIISIQERYPTLKILPVRANLPAHFDCTRTR